MKKSNYVKWAFTVVLCCSIAVATAKNVYLSSSGSDSNDGLTALTPVASFSKAYSKTVANDIVMVSGFIDFSVDPLNTATPRAGITVAKNLTIQGNSLLIDGFDGRNLTRFLVVSATYTLTLKNMTLKNGRYNSSVASNLGGGAIYLQGNLNGENIIFDGNSVVPDAGTSPAPGGVIKVESTAGISFKNTVFSNNYASKGGVVYVEDTKSANAAIRFENCSFISNTSNSPLNGLAGSVFFLSLKTANTINSLSFINCTMAKNRVTNSADGGTIYLYTSTISPSSTNVNITNCTMTENTSAGSGSLCAGIRVATAFVGTLNINNSIIEGNLTTNTTNKYSDLSLQITTPLVTQLVIHNSIIGQNGGSAIPSTCYPAPNQFNYLSGTANPANLIAKLAPFNASYNYYPLLTGSPAIDYGASTYLSSLTPSITTDQLGNTRPFASGKCYTGAVETNYITVNADANLSALGATPTSDVIVSSGKTLTVDASNALNNITVTGGGRLSVATNQTLALSNLTLKSDATNGTSTFINEGTLTVSGTTSVEQYLATTRNWYVSSPVTNANAPAGYTYYSRYEPGGTATGWTPVSVGAGLIAGVGYIALPSTAGVPITFTTQSGGSLNNGTIPVSLTYTPAATSGSGYNLIGNPYPSHLTWNKAFTDANVAKIEPTIWYRTNSGSSNSGGWLFKTYNAYTGVGSPDGTTGIIPPMQAFWVLAKQTTSINFTNTMRSHQTGNPLKAPSAKTSENKLLRLQISNGLTTDETVVLFNPNAADGYDNYDSPKMMNNAADIADIYTMADSKRLVINGMSSVKYDTEIPIGFSTLIAYDFSISANEMTNFEAGTQVILVDKLLTKQIDLTNGTLYNFSSGITSPSTDRFSVIFRAPGVATGIDNTTKLNVQVFINTVNQITIIAPEKATYSIYNAIGQKQYESMLTSTKTTINKAFGAGVYVVYLAVNGQSEIQKVIIR